MYSKTENKELKQRFWIEFGQRCSKLKTKKASPHKWILYKTGVKGIALKFETPEKSVAVVLEINHPDESARHDLFSKILNLQPKLDEIFSEPLLYVKDFELPIGTMVSRVYFEHKGLYVNNKTQQNEIFSFFISRMFKLEKVFLYFKSTIDEFSFADEEDS